MEINWLTLIIEVLGGLALFLYGMTIMTDGLKLVAGKGMKNFLAKMTSNRWKGLFAGASITAVIQSSSVTTVLAVGFVSAGLISFENTLGIIFGANIGTTITAQIIAFKVTKAALIFVFVGFLLNVAFNQKKIKDTGLIILGLGLVFLGMTMMSEGTAPLKSFDPFVSLMKGLDNPFMGILIGTVFTVVVQSSSATTGIVIVMATQGLLSVNGGIAIIIGANIGTCFTAILSTLGKPQVALQVAMAHVLFNLLGAIIWLAFIPLLANLVNEISTNNAARQIANAHTIFNIANTFLFIGFSNQLAKLVKWIVPIKKKDSTQLIEIDNYFLNDTTTALEITHSNIIKLNNHLISILKPLPELILKGNKNDLTNQAVDLSNMENGRMIMLEFLAELQKQKLTKDEIQQVRYHVDFINVIQMSCDIIDELFEAGNTRIDQNFYVSENTYQILLSLLNDAIQSLETLFILYKKEEKRSKSKSLEIRKDYKNKLNTAHKHLVSRLVNNTNKRLFIFTFETQIHEITSQIYSLSNRVN